MNTYTFVRVMDDNETIEPIVYSTRVELLPCDDKI